MGNSKTISVIIPAYNAERFLPRALDSVISQTYQDLEILVIDDGSQDATGQIADAYATKDPRVRVLHVSNNGEAKARNLALSEASGSYITFCDADDCMHPDMIEKLYRQIQEEDLDIAVCSWKNVDEDGNELNWPSPNLNSCCLTSLEAQKQFLMSLNFEGFCWNKLIKKSLYEKIGIQYDESRLSFCDMYANYRLIQSAERLGFVNEKLYDYYQLPSSCIHTPNTKKCLDYFDVLEQIKTAAEKEHLIYEGNGFRRYRTYKFLYDVLKDRELYKSSDLCQIYNRAFEKHTAVSIGSDFKLAFDYNFENPVKFLIKIAYVKLFHWKLNRQKCSYL